MEETSQVEATRYKNLPTPLKVIIFVLSSLGIGIGIFYNFGFRIEGQILTNFAYYCLFIAIYSSCVFLIIPARKKDKMIPWYDLLAGLLVLGSCFYFFLNSYEMTIAGWECLPLGIIVWLLIMEGGRRSGGFIYLIVCTVLSLYPLFASHMPGMLWGDSYNFTELVTQLIFREAGLMGLLTKVVTEILLGFLVFAGVLIASGAGAFFFNLANILLGRFRGGPAKVAVLSSGFFGSLSGSIFSNIIATGSVTIPTMKRIGYPPHYAGAIEACASTGGVLMPPVMGAVAFIMCQILSMEYTTVIVAAAVPAILYYFGLLIQVDAYAARVGLKGLPREEIPSLRKTLKEGWPFIFVFIFLLWGLLYMRWERLAPWYASGILILLSFSSRKTMLTPRRLVDALATVGGLVTQTVAIIFPISFIMCGLTITGVSGSFTAGLVNFAGGNIFAVLIVGVLACYIMGMAGMATATYIFLAVSLAPAVIQIANFNVLAVHLFIIYYSMLAGITPPVAASAFLAGTMAGANLMRTAWQAMRLGIVIYFIPFFFLFNPALVLQGESLLESFWLFALCLVGIVLIAGGFEGYLVKIGRLELWARPLLAISGILIGFPEWITTIIGAILALLVVAIIWIMKKR